MILNLELLINFSRNLSRYVVDKTVTDHVPDRINSSRNSLPWKIKKDMKVCKRLYNKAKRRMIGMPTVK